MFSFEILKDGESVGEMDVALDDVAIVHCGRDREEQRGFGWRFRSRLARGWVFEEVAIFFVCGDLLQRTMVHGLLREGEGQLDFAAGLDGGEVGDGDGSGELALVGFAGCGAAGS